MCIDSRKKVILEDTGPSAPKTMPTSVQNEW